jgi:hypothetical protein
MAKKTLDTSMALEVLRSAQMFDRASKRNEKGYLAGRSARARWRRTRHGQVLGQQRGGAGMMARRKDVRDAS